MSVDQATVHRIARLARIAVQEQEIPHLQGEINAILSFVEELSAVDVEGVEPMTSVIPMKLPVREDVVTDGEIPQKVLANAPLTEGGFFLVPKSSNRTPPFDRSDRTHACRRALGAPREAPLQRRTHSRLSRRDRQGEGPQRLCRRHRRPRAENGGSRRRAPRQRRGRPARRPDPRDQRSLRDGRRAHAGVQPHPRQVRAS